MTFLCRLTECIDGDTINEAVVAVENGNDPPERTDILRIDRRDRRGYPEIRHDTDGFAVGSLNLADERNCPEARTPEASVQRPRTEQLGTTTTKDHPTLRQHQAKAPPLSPPCFDDYAREYDLVAAKT